MDGSIGGVSRLGSPEDGGREGRRIPPTDRGEGGGVARLGGGWRQGESARGSREGGRHGRERCASVPPDPFEEEGSEGAVAGRKKGKRAPPPARKKRRGTVAGKEEGEGGDDAGEEEEKGRRFRRALLGERRRYGSFFFRARQISRKTEGPGRYYGRRVVDAVNTGWY